jgi:hypothetical protein
MSGTWFGIPHWDDKGYTLHVGLSATGSLRKEAETEKDVVLGYKLS